MNIRCCNRVEYYDEIDGKDVKRKGCCDGSESVRNLIAFFVLGLINNFAYVVFLSAAATILKGTDIPISAILVCEILPGMIIQGIAPFFMERIPFWLRVCFISLTSGGSFLIVRFAPELWMKLGGIVLASISCSFGEITFMALSSYYHKNVVSLYSSGTGGAGIFGSLLYLALLEWFGVSADLTLIVCSPIPLLIGVAYFVILEYSRKKQLEKIETESQPTKRKKKFLSANEKLSLQKSLLKFSMPLFIVYFSEYLINQGIAPVITFPQDKTFKEQYVYYQFIYQVGVFISRSSVNFIQLKNLWCIAFWQVLNMIFLFIAAYLGFIPSIWIVFAIILYEGLLGGAIYVNAFYRMADEIADDVKEFCMSSVSFWYSCGILAAALSGLGVEPWLMANKQH